MPNSVIQYKGATPMQVNSSTPAGYRIIFFVIPYKHSTSSLGSCGLYLKPLATLTFLHFMREPEDDKFGGPNGGHAYFHYHFSFQNIEGTHSGADAT